MGLGLRGAGWGAPCESVNQTLLPGGLTQPTTPAPLSEHTSE